MSKVKGRDRNHTYLSYCLIIEKDIRSLYDEFNDKGKRRNIQGIRKKIFCMGLSDRKRVHKRIPGAVWPDADGG